MPKTNTASVDALALFATAAAFAATPDGVAEDARADAARSAATVARIRACYGNERANRVEDRLAGIVVVADTPCRRCQGRGYIDTYRYVNGGVCFDCNGDG